MKTNDSNKSDPKSKSVGSADFFTPENIEVIAKVVSATIGIATTTISAISIWVEERKSKSIKLKYEDLEIEISGMMNKDDIEEKLEIFSNYHKKFQEEKVKIEISNTSNSSNKTNSEKEIK